LARLALALFPGGLWFGRASRWQATASAMMGCDPLLPVAVVRFRDGRSPVDPDIGDVRVSKNMRGTTARAGWSCSRNSAMTLWLQVPSATAGSLLVSMGSNGPD